jgi:hypothetical protein
MKSLDLNQMPLSEKFLMLEALWENLSKDAQNRGFTPSWHREVLNHRALKVDNAESSFSDIVEVQKRLAKLCQ